ncbi:hypothetical protein EDD58_103503 [Hazenella coriacea]|uniref:Membrane protein YczE n=2 Tax=Hazenella coriacea TaxID=1179467 RepID=A0A4V6NZ94_9BACL|nr:hypothetical protein EDD58_103503 [Hazenella coriacea]
MNRIIAYFIGLAFLGLGITIAIQADIGTGAWDALNVGLAKLTGLSVGSWVIIVGIALIFINAILMRERPDFYAMLTSFSLGLIIDGWFLIISVEPTAWIWKFLLFILGMLVTALGLATYLQAKFAPTSIDRLMYAISKLTGFSLRTSKTIGEVIALLLAWMIGGPIGIGTILITFLIGPLLHLFLPYMESLFHTK